MKKEICANLCKSVAEKPKRKRGCLGGCLISGMAVVALVAVLAVWIHILGRDIEPADFSDLALPPIEDIAPEDNAYTYFVKAAEVMVSSYTDENGKPVSFGKYLRDNRTNIVVVAKVIADNEETLKYLQQGVQCQRCVFPIPTNFKEAGIPPFGRGIDMAMLLRNKVRYEQERGNADVALQDVHTLLRYGQLMQQSPYALINILVGFAIDGIGVGEFQRLTRDSQLSDDQLRYLLELASDIPPYDASVQYGLKADFRYCILVMEWFMEDMKARGLSEMGLTVSASIYRYSFLPNQTRLDLADYFRGPIRESSKFYANMNHYHDDDFDRLKTNYFYRRYIENKNKLWACLTALSCRNMVGKILENLMMPATADILDRRCRMDGTVAATRIIVACHLFQRETGRRLQALDELVPEYLPSVPLDPFDGQPFRYKPDDCIVYSVGKSLTDLGGAVWASDTPRDQQELDEVQTNPWAGDNAVFHIWEQ